MSTNPSAQASGGGLLLQAATPEAGFALQNATPTIISWTAPADGKLHRALILSGQDVTSAATGGQINASTVQPDGSAVNKEIIAGNQGAGGNFMPPVSFMVEPGATVIVSQQTALTAGAVTVWAEIWGQ